MDRREHARMEREFFDGLADGWDEMYAGDARKAEYVAEALGLREGDRVLDVGAGTGAMIAPCLSRIGASGSITSIDASERMISVARRKFPPGENPNVTLLAMDAYDLEPGGGFDAAVCHSCLPHLYDKPLAVRIVSGCLRDGGRLAISHSCSMECINRAHSCHGSVIRRDMVPSIGEISAMMEACGVRPSFSRSDEECHMVVGVKGA
ncbi:MAG: methyltransferase domain-containing protein [Candidatus Methanoplasma sp.]|jgi:demethylmenaquinone methyltransferase/2-methoxy-6-polyprenyl-1,4-benzoquinol methylase|nr:methyltransferase domain-containing protein [Candidatus Methanoplasma sp.]